MHHVRKGPILLVAIISVLALLPPALGQQFCDFCKYSPHNFGFCYSTINSGYDSCSEYVADSFSGRTDCNLGNMCGTVIGGGGGGGGCEDDPWCFYYY